VKCMLGEAVATTRYRGSDWFLCICAEPSLVVFEGLAVALTERVCRSNVRGKIGLFGGL